jgi:hypothetical protein
MSDEQSHGSPADPQKRICPTRADGLLALMAATIHVSECQRRQREHFHKCPTCVHYNARAITPPSPSTLPGRALGS